MTSVTASCCCCPFDRRFEIPTLTKAYCRWFYVEICIQFQFCDCLIVAHPHLLFSRLNFIDFWGAASVHFLLLNFLAGFYCTLSYKLSSAPLTLSSPVSPLLCAHTQKIHPLFSNEKNIFLDLISIAGGRPIVNKTLEPLLYCSPVYDFI